jgi:hypothetical protein
LTFVIQVVTELLSLTMSRMSMNEFAWS